MNQEECPFCDSMDSILENEYAYVRYDKYPVSDGHLLIIPYRHVDNYFDLTDDEKNSLQELLQTAKTIVDNEHSPDGYNIVINIGEAAGQAIPHVHMHLIPRYKADKKDPKAVAREVIPGLPAY